MTNRPSPLSAFGGKFSSLVKLTKPVAWLFKVKKALIPRVRARKGGEKPDRHTDNDLSRLSVRDERNAEVEILSHVQQESLLKTLIS